MNSPINSFSSTENTRVWETNWPAADEGPVVKILYDWPSGELRVHGQWKGESFNHSRLLSADGVESRLQWFLDYIGRKPKQDNGLRQGLSQMLSTVRLRCLYGVYTARLRCDLPAG